MTLEEQVAQLLAMINPEEQAHAVTMLVKILDRHRTEATWMKLRLNEHTQALSVRLIGDGFRPLGTFQVNFPLTLHDFRIHNSVDAELTAVVRTEVIEPDPVVQP